MDPIYIQKKKCYMCGEDKVLDDFYEDKSKSGTHGRASSCKKCTNGRKRNRDRRKQRRYDRVYRLRKTYGLSIERFNEMQVEQDRKCAICKNPLGIDGKGSISAGLKNSFNVDHNHSTGKVRGLLCGNCNKGIGFFKESTTFLINAVSYLNKYNEDFIDNIL